MNFSFPKILEERAVKMRKRGRTNRLIRKKGPFRSEIPRRRGLPKRQGVLIVRVDENFGDLICSGRIKDGQKFRGIPRLIRWEINDLTKENWLIIWLFRSVEIGLKLGKEGTQGCSQVSKFELMETGKQVPLERIFMVLRISVQVQEGWLLPGLRVRKFFPQTYFGFKRLTHNLSLFERMHHPSFEIRARLTSQVLLKPKPPWILGKQIES